MVGGPPAGRVDEIPPDAPVRGVGVHCHLLDVRRVGDDLQQKVGDHTTLVIADERPSRLLIPAQ